MCLLAWQLLMCRSSASLRHYTMRLFVYEVDLCLCDRCLFNTSSLLMQIHLQLDIVNNQTFYKPSMSILQRSYSKQSDRKLYLSVMCILSSLVLIIVTLFSVCCTNQEVTSRTSWQNIREKYINTLRVLCVGVKR